MENFEEKENRDLPKRQSRPIVPSRVSEINNIELQ